VERFGELLFERIDYAMRRARAKRVKAKLYQLLLSAFMLCFLLVMFGTYEEFVIPSFIVGSICLVSFLIAREKVKKT